MRAKVPAYSTIPDAAFQRRRREVQLCYPLLAPRLAGVVTAPVPAPIIEKGLASDRVVIDAVIAKYCDHLPLYGQSAMFLRDAGMEISRVTLCGWIMRVGDLLAPVVAATRRLYPGG